MSIVGVPSQVSLVESKRAPAAPWIGPSGVLLRDQPDRGAVLRRDVVDVVHGDEAAGAGHVLDDDGGIAGQVPAEMTGHQPAP